MQDQDGPQGTLFAMNSGVNAGGFQLSPLEKSVMKAVAQIIELRPDDFMVQALGELAMDLARNITLGNLKGRAVANEAAQLATTLDQIKGDTDSDDTTQLPAGVLQFVQALQSRPAKPSEVRHTA